MSEQLKTLLVVDDEKFIRQSFADFFEDRLWEIIEAESGEQALELLKENSPMAAIVDIRLGGMDGNDFIRRAYDNNPNMVFIICTGSSDYEIPNEFKSLTRLYKRVFSKPVTEIAELEQELIPFFQETIKGGA